MKLALRKTPATGANWLSRVAAWAIKARLVSQYCHGGIVIGDVLYHATAQHGVTLSTFNPENWDLIDLGTERDSTAEQILIDHIGAGYDWFSLLAFVIPAKFTDGKRWYCFEWCWYLMTGVNPSFRVTPELLICKSREMKSEC